MYLKILACDLDGTLAQHGVIDDSIWKALRELRKKGLTLMLVTGRTLATFEADGPFAELFEAIVAEDGAAVYFTKNNSVSLPFGRLDKEVLRQLEQRHVPLERGIAIVATRTPHDEIVDEVLRDTGRSATVEYNKGAVMVLPPGATKGAGLRYALQELGYSQHNVIACGDAENDRSLFEVAEYAVAAYRSTPEIQELADFTIDKPYPAGIREFIESLGNDWSPPITRLSKYQFNVGRKLDGNPLRIDPHLLVNGNTGIVGSSNTGKSWLAGLLGERLLQKGYQICIVDPEGDYTALRAFPHTLLLGGKESRLPRPVDILTLSEYTSVSLILDLSMYGLEERVEYVTDLLRALFGLRARRGRPHWFLLDEIHSFCPPDGNLLTELVTRGMAEGGVGVVSYRPSFVAPQVLEMIDTWFLTRFHLQDEQSFVETYLPSCPNWQRLAGHLPTLPAGDAYLLRGGCDDKFELASIDSFRADDRKVPHVRHLHKYLKAPLPSGKRFYFKENGSGRRVAASLWEFREAMGDISLSTLRFHLDRGDFERWLKDVLHDEELARRLRKIRRRTFEADDLRDVLESAVADRYEELESLI